MAKPPPTERMCLHCNEITPFRYNHRIGHSECDYCGFRWITAGIKMVRKK